MRLACHYNPKNRRSISVAHAMFDGAQALGIEAKTVIGFEQPAGDVGVAYGWGHPDLFEAYRRQGGHFVYLDLGWWYRKPPHDVLGGYHKVCVDAREPTAYFRRNSPMDRFTRTGLQVAPWRATGGKVLIAGMSEKSARTRGFQPQEWETRAAQIIRQICPGRPCTYRPKPSWTGAWPIDGTIYSPPSQPLESALADCWAVVTCHSNVAVDALLAGIPVHVDGGVAEDFSTPWADLDNPLMPAGREQLLADIAYCQFSVAEIASGACLRHLLEHTPLGRPQA